MLHAQFTQTEVTDGQLTEWFVNRTCAHKRLLETS